MNAGILYCCTARRPCVGHTGTGTVTWYVCERLYQVRCPSRFVAVHADDTGIPLAGAATCATNGPIVDDLNHRASQISKIQWR